MKRFKWVHCLQKSTIGDNIKRHKYFMHDGVGHGCEQCYNKYTKVVIIKPKEFLAWRYEVQM